MDYPGNLFVVAAPSGAGKSSLVKALRELDSHVMPSVSHTTRAPRGQEKHGREYFFVSEAEFDQMVLQSAFVEWAEVHKKRYGTSKKAIEDRIAHGADVILEIDWQGAMQIKRIYPNATLIFILPPSWDELRSRLERRGEDTSDVIETRLANAAAELAQAKEFDFPHRVVRQVRYREPKLYMDNALAGKAIAQDEEVTRAQLPFEFMLNALRLRDGFVLQDFVDRTGLPLSAIEKPLKEAEAKGLVERDFAKVRPTERGFDFLSDLQALFLAD